MLVKARVTILSKPKLKGGYWSDWEKAKLKRFPGIPDLEDVSDQFFTPFSEHFDEFIVAYIEGCPLAVKIFPYLVFYIRTRRMKLPQARFLAWLDIDQYGIKFTPQHSNWRNWLKTNPQRVEKLKLGLITGEMV